MLDLDRIGTRCSRITETLDVKAGDPVGLLRTARILKNVHSDLKQLLWQQSKRTGWTEGIAQTQLALELTERDLRLVLLEYESMSSVEVCECLRKACDQFQLAIDVLEQAALRSVFPAGNRGRPIATAGLAVGAE